MGYFKYIEKYLGLYSKHAGIHLPTRLKKYEHFAIFPSNLYSKEWPLRTFNYNYPPAKFVWQEGDRVGMATNSMVSEGCIVSGGTISRCVLSPEVRINSFSTVSDSILMENVNVGRYSEIRKAIIDYNDLNYESSIKYQNSFVFSLENQYIIDKACSLRTNRVYFSCLLFYEDIENYRECINYKNQKLKKLVNILRFIRL